MNRWRESQLEARAELVEALLLQPAPRLYACTCGLVCSSIPGQPVRLWPSGREHLCPRPIPPAITMTEEDIERFDAELREEQDKARLPHAVRDARQRAQRPENRQKPPEEGSGPPKPRIVL